MVELISFQNDTKNCIGKFLVLMEAENIAVYFLCNFGVKRSNLPLRLQKKNIYQPLQIKYSLYQKENAMGESFIMINVFIKLIHHFELYYHNYISNVMQIKPDKSLCLLKQLQSKLQTTQSQYILNRFMKTQPQQKRTKQFSNQYKQQLSVQTIPIHKSKKKEKQKQKKCQSNKLKKYIKYLIQKNDFLKNKLLQKNKSSTSSFNQKSQLQLINTQINYLKHLKNKKNNKIESKKLLNINRQTKSLNNQFIFNSFLSNEKGKRKIQFNHNFIYEKQKKQLQSPNRIPNLKKKYLPKFKEGQLFSKTRFNINN